MSTQKNTRIYKKTMGYRFPDGSFSEYHMPHATIKLIEDYKFSAFFYVGDPRSIKVLGFDLEKDIALIKISAIRHNAYTLIGRTGRNVLVPAKSICLDDEITCLPLACKPGSKLLKTMLPHQVIQWAERQACVADRLITGL